MFINSPFNYTGNKYRLLPQLISWFPDFTEKMTLIDLFSGSGTVSFNAASRFKHVISNEYIGDIQRIQHILMSGSDSEFLNLIDCLKQFSSSDYAIYQRLRDDYNAYMTADFTGHAEYIQNQQGFLNEKAYRLYGLMLSCTNNMLRFNQHGLFNQTCGKRMYNKSIEKKLIEWRNLLKTIHNVTISAGDFEKCTPDSMEDRTDMFFYADPPYSNTAAGYNAFWKSTDDERLFNFIMNNQNSKWMVSGTQVHGLDRCRLLDLLSETGKFQTIYLEHDYAKVARKKGTEVREVIMINYHKGN